MGYVNSPSNNQPHSHSDKTTLRHVKALLLHALRRTKTFWKSQKLPLAANKACEIYLGDAGKGYQASCRRLLKMRVDLNPAQLSRMFHTSLGHDLLTWVGRFFHLPNRSSSDDTLKDVLLQMAAAPEGLSLLGFLHHFPESLRLNVDQLSFLAKRVETLLKTADATIETIRKLSILEAGSDRPVDFSNLPDLRQPGAYNVKQQTLWIRLPWVEAHPEPGESPRLQALLQVFCYQPHPWPVGPVPVIVQSHGLASSPRDMAPYAEHLASYGYFVAVPRHGGSDATYVRNMLAGHTPEVFSLNEFVDRPLAIRALLDELERCNLSDFDRRLNLRSVGVMGYSFGAYTAFALAGATIQFDKLETACGVNSRDPNLSLLLQCQALGLPRQPYHLADDRIRAIMALDSVGSEVFGPQGIEPVQVPVLLMAGSQDITAPLTFEQVRFFRWLHSPYHYLALMQGKSHIQDMQRFVNALDLQIRLSPQGVTSTPTAPFEQYTKALSVAFFNQHLATWAMPYPYLSAEYAAYISCDPFHVWFMSQKSRAALQHTLDALDKDLATDANEQEHAPGGDQTHDPTRALSPPA